MDTYVENLQAHHEYLSSTQAVIEELMEKGNEAIEDTFVSIDGLIEL